ncbi:MAG: sigma-70 family RNA polymerase sigma factor [Bacteroidota bacterium]
MNLTLKNAKNMNINSNEFTSALNEYLKGDKKKENAVFAAIWEASNKNAKNCLAKYRCKYVEPEDIAQTVCEKLCSGKLEKFDFEKGGFDGWLYRVVKNQVFDETRKNSKTPEVPFEASHEIEKIPQVEVAEEWDVLKLNEVMADMHVLSADEKLVMEQLFAGNTSVKEIAKALELPSDWVSTKKWSAKKKLEREQKRRKGLTE